ncbi:MAG: carbohydrate-binding protein [Sphaerochaetaceae bacterium]
MDAIKLRLVSKDGKTLREGRKSGGGVSIVYDKAYQDGDCIIMEHQGQPSFFAIRFEEALGEALVYCENEVSYPIPLRDMRQCFPPMAFNGEMHVISVRSENPTGRRNLALNPYDNHDNKGLFPHASANVETRNEMIFAARNAIDGIFENHGHGSYPYCSWGINRDPKAAFTLDFGRKIIVSELRLTLRTDFPHDSYWTQARVEFDDGAREILDLSDSDLPQCFTTKERVTRTLVLKNLIKAKDESPFPALTQIEVWGEEFSG